MGIADLPDSTDIATGEIIEASDILAIIAALEGALVGRSTSGVATALQSFGTALLPWGNIFGTSLIIGGSAIDVSGLTAAQNRIISGKTRATSGQPFFLNPNGAAASVLIQGAATTLSVSINGTVVEVTTDITEAGLTVAPSSNNTCTINDTSFVDQTISKYFGEIDSQKPTITLDAVGSEISSRVGQIIALKTATSEIMVGFLKSATEFTDVKRGFLFDSSNAPIVRETLANNDVLTLLETGWPFITNDALTVDVTYLTPVYSFTAPSGVLGQYWFDMTNQVWKRHSGVEFVSINRTLLGVCVQDTTNCIGARSFDFDNAFDDTNTIDAEVFSDTVVRSVSPDNTISIYGTSLEIPYTHIEFDNTADMETGSVAADTEYYLYLTTDGESQISVERPYDRWGDLRGRYHPYNNWRYICEAKTDVDSDWLSVISSSAFDGLDKSADFETSPDLIFDWATSTTATLTASSMKLLNREGAGKMIFGVDDTFDITLHRIDGTGTTNLLASTIYDCWYDTDGNKKMAPNLSSVADADVLNSLSNTVGGFQTHLVQRWDEIYQTTDLTKGYVKSVTTDGLLTIMDKDGIDLDLFPLGTESYKIRMLSPPGLGEFRGRIGNVVTDSGKNINDSYYTQIPDPIKYTGTEAAGEFNITGAQVNTSEGQLFPYQNAEGEWWLEGRVQILTNNSTDQSFAITGIIFAKESSIACSKGVVTCRVNSSLNTVSATLTAASTFSEFYINVQLTRKPTWATRS